MNLDKCLEIIKDEKDKLRVLCDILDDLKTEAVFIASADFKEGDEGNEIIYVNKRGIELLKEHKEEIKNRYGYEIDVENLIGTSIHKFHKKDLEYSKSLLKALKPGQITKHPDIHISENVIVELDLAGVFDDNGKPICYLALWTDVTDKRALEKTLLLKDRLTKFNRLLGEINQYINLIEDEKELLQKICDITIQFTDAKLAWIGKPDKTGRIQFLAASGEVGYLDNIFISTDPNIPEGQGPTGKTWRDKKPYFFNSFLENEHTKLWQERARKFGIGMNATLPVFKNKEIYAVFNFYLPEYEKFDKDLIEVLTEIGKDISHGLDRLELLRRERELNKLNEALINNSTSGIIIGRYPDRVIEYANSRFVQMLGYDSEKELIGKSGKEIFPSDKEFLEVYNLVIKDVLENGYGKTTDIPFKKKDGSIIHIDLSGVKLSDNPARIVWTFVDVEDRYQYEKKLDKQIKFNKILLHNTAAGFIIIKYPERIIEYVNQRMVDILKAKSELDFIGKHTEFLFADKEYYKKVGELAKKILEDGNGYIRNVPYRRFDGSVVHVDKFGQKLIIENEEKILWTYLDVEDRYRAQKELEQQLSFNKILLNNLTAGVFIIRYPDRIIEYVNQKGLEMFGAEEEYDVIGHFAGEFYPTEEDSIKAGKTMVKEILEKGYATARNITYKKLDGTVFHCDLSGQKYPSEDGIVRIIWTLVDVEERYKLEKELENQAITDILTSIPNRRALEREIERAFNRSKRSKKLLAVCMLDLDNFKPINDKYGHEAGDEVLKIVAKRLSSVIRNIDFVARLGGDEFVVLLEDLNSKDEIYDILERIETIIKEPIILSNGNIVNVGVSIGVSLYEPDKFDIQNESELIRTADKALYESKAHKLDRIRSFVIF